MDVSRIPVRDNDSKPKRYLSTLAFDNRFTTLERASLDLASIDVPTATAAERMLAAQLRVYLQRANKATFVDTTRQDTREGVMALEQLGILAPGRALEILDAPVTDFEMYRGPGL